MRFSRHVTQTSILRALQAFPSLLYQGEFWWALNSRQQEYLRAQKGKRININSHHPSRSFYQHHFYHMPFLGFGDQLPKWQLCREGVKAPLPSPCMSSDTEHIISSECLSLTGTLLGKLSALQHSASSGSCCSCATHLVFKIFFGMWREHNDAIRVPVSSHFLILIFCPWGHYLIPWQ